MTTPWSNVKSVFFCALACLALALLPVCAQSTEAVRADVVYVTTPHEVVAEMLRLAQVRAGDRVYDLGSGDGRIVIAAARDHGARGVGIEIDPKLIEKSRRNAEEAGVAERVEFFQKDLFQTDLRAASVVTLYLLPDLNLRLRPRLFEQLQPGARVVSHAFPMDDWPPDEETTVGRTEIFLWIIPANVSGRWEWRSHENTDDLHQLHLEQTFQQVSGYLRNNAGFFPISWAVLRGEHLLVTFAEGMDDSGRPAVLVGRVSNERIEGTMSRSDAELKTWQARREGGMMKPLDAGW